MSWTYEHRNLGPLAVARVFAESSFGEPREIDEESLSGKWANGHTYKGTFLLIDGFRTYSIEGKGGRWTVEPLSEGEEQAES